MDFSTDDLLKEVTFKTSRSGGKGGQHVNKVSSKVELNFNISTSCLFTNEQKEQLSQKLVKNITAAGVIQIISDEERSQYLNKQRALKKLYLMLIKALHQPKPRKTTRPKRSAIENRLKNKLLQAQKKISRKRNFPE